MTTAGRPVNYLTAHPIRVSSTCKARFAPPRNGMPCFLMRLIFPMEAEAFVCHCPRSALFALACWNPNHAARPLRSADERFGRHMLQIGTIRYIIPPAISADRCFTSNTRVADTRSTCWLRSSTPHKSFPYLIYALSLLYLFLFHRSPQTPALCVASSIQGFSSHIPRQCHCHAWPDHTKRLPGSCTGSQ